MKITQEMFDRLQVSANVKEQQRKWQETQEKQENKQQDAEDIRREIMWELSHTL